MPYELKGNCVIKANTGEEIKCHETLAEAEAHLKALMANVPDVDKYAGARHSASDIADIQTLHDISVRQGAACASDKMHIQTQIDCFLVEQFVATKSGEPYLWLPYGTIRKGDSVRDVTPELAAKFKLPHFKPPVKLGSHEETTPAGGHIVRHEIRNDGIWVYPELVPNGEKALADGAYRYHSPEIIWEDGAIQNPLTGQWESGPFIMGDALLHTPHLGESTALYSIPISVERNSTMADTISIPTAMYESFMSLFKRTTEPPAEPPEVAQLKVKASQAETYKAELDQLKAQAARASEIAALVAELQVKESYGALFVEANTAQFAAEHFHAMPKETREWAQKQIKALVAQVDQTALLKKFGQGEQNKGGGTATEKFHAEITKIATEKKLTYQAAVTLAAQANPELYRAYLEER